MLMTQTEYAEYRGWNQSYISRLIQKGKIPKSAMVGKKIDSEKADKALDKNIDPANRKKKTNIEIPAEEKQKIVQKAGIEPIDYHTARTLNEKYKAALNKLEYEQKSGKLVDRDDVEKRSYNSERQIRDQVSSIPDRCAALVAAESDSFNCKQILLKEINYILENLSETLKILNA